RVAHVRTDALVLRVYEIPEHVDVATVMGGRHLDARDHVDAADAGVASFLDAGGSVVIRQGDDVQSTRAGGADERTRRQTSIGGRRVQMQIYAHGASLAVNIRGAGTRRKALTRSGASAHGNGARDTVRDAESERRVVRQRDTAPEDPPLADSDVRADVDVEVEVGVGFLLIADLDGDELEDGTRVHVREDGHARARLPEVDTHARAERYAHGGEAIAERGADARVPRDEERGAGGQVDGTVELGAEHPEAVVRVAADAAAHAQVDVAALAPDRGKAQVAALGVDAVHADIVVRARREEAR